MVGTYRAVAMTLLIGAPAQAATGRLGAPAHAASGPLSISGQPLDSCSKPGMAMTGSTLRGDCREASDPDAVYDNMGWPHICIPVEDEFCNLTDQPNWCADELECMGQGNQSLCPIGNWCVSAWDFIRYMHMAGGCDAIVELECEATSIQAVRAYEDQAHAGETQFKDVLKCIKKKCPQMLITESMLNDAPLQALRTGGAGGADSSLASQTLFGPLAIACLLGAIAAIGIGGACACLVAKSRRPRALASPDEKAALM